MLQSISVLFSDNTLLEFKKKSQVRLNAKLMQENGVASKRISRSTAKLYFKGGKTHGFNLQSAKVTLVDKCISHLRIMGESVLLLRGTTQVTDVLIIIFCFTSLYGRGNVIYLSD